MMPDQNSFRSAADAPARALVRPTIVSIRLPLRDLFTGGSTQPLAGLPTALGRPLLRWAAAARSRVAGFRRRPRRTGADPDAARDREYLDALRADPALPANRSAVTGPDAAAKAGEHQQPQSSADHPTGTDQR